MTVAELPTLAPAIPRTSGSAWRRQMRRSRASMLNSMGRDAEAARGIGFGSGRGIEFDGSTFGDLVCGSGTEIGPSLGQVISRTSKSRRTRVLPAKDLGSHR